MNREIIAHLRHGLVPAVPVPFIDNQIDESSQQRYAVWMATQAIAGVAVWAHTGRGLRLGEDDRARVISCWRKALPKKIIVAGAGGSREVSEDADYIASAVRMGMQAKSLGADALLCYAPARFRDRQRSQRDKLILQYHEQLASCGLPMILFYLYEAAGGIAYSPDVLKQLLTLDQVIGIKIATLDSIMTYQDVATVCKYVAPDKLVITGEDRFLGYSLMCGADAALIGMGAAYTNLQAEFLACFFGNDLSSFHMMNARIDQLAQATFTAPMEGYIARTAYILSKQGLIDPGSWRDPWGPAINQDELDTIDTLMSHLEA